MGNFDLESGKRLMDEGDLVDAIRCFLSSVDQDPTDPEAYVELFKAYALAWHESGDPLVLDQMRKVAIAGLKRGASPGQRRLLEEGLEQTEAEIVAIQQAEEDLERQQAARARKLPMFKGDDGS
jgi:hypothetical protein